MSRSHSVKSTVTESDSVLTEPVALHAASSPQYAAALASVAPELLALSASELLTINSDLAVVCTTVSGVLPGLLALRPQFAQLQGLDPTVVEPLALALIDKLPFYLGRTPRGGAPENTQPRCDNLSSARGDDASQGVV